MKENFVICIESLHVADLGDKDNVSNAQQENLLHICILAIEMIFHIFLHTLSTFICFVSFFRV